MECGNCRRRVASIAFGRFDFLRIDKLTANTEDGENPFGHPGVYRLPGEFLYRRIPWNQAEVKTLGFVPRDVEWNHEGYRGCLFSEDPGQAEISFTTDATDIAVRMLRHAWSGIVEISMDGQYIKDIDLYSATEHAVVSFLVAENLPAATREIKLRLSSRKNPASHGRQVWFYGFDLAEIVESLEIPSRLNRGNGFPATYQWAMDQLPKDALVLDCGCGDRRFGDPRMIGIEYLPFELPQVFGDGHSLPFLDNAFDAVFSQAVLEHMADPYRAAAEIARVTKPGGLIYVESAFMQPLHAVPYHFFNTTPLGLEQVFQKAGASKLKTEWFGGLAPSFEWYLSACGVKEKISPQTFETLLAQLGDIDRQIAYEGLRHVASAVAYWGFKPDRMGASPKHINMAGCPSFEY